MTADPTTPIQAVVQITLGQVYEQVSNTRNEVRDLAAAVHAALAQGADHEARIRILEQRMWKAVGASSVISAGLSSAITLYTSAH